MKSKYLVSIIFCLLSIFELSTSVSANNPVVPWSKTINSSGGKFVLVLISPKIKEQTDYVNRLRDFWKKGGISAESIPEAEKALQEEIDQEIEICKKYPESGLYTSSDSPQLLWKIELYDTESWYLISDDGEHLVVGKYKVTGIKQEDNIEGNPQVKEVVKSTPNLEQVILTFYSFGKPIRSYKAFELVDKNNLQKTTSDDFMWSDERVLNERERILYITKKNGEKLIFDIITGNLLSGKLTSQQSSPSDLETNKVQIPKSESSKSFCGGVALLLGLILSVLFGR
jgi:hypothetical protein